MKHAHKFTRTFKQAGVSNHNWHPQLAILGILEQIIAQS